MSKELLVDDSPVDIYRLRRMLEQLSYEVISAENGRDGIAAASAKLPHIVLMDIVLSDMNRFQATRQICRGSDTNHIPIIIVSSKDQETGKVWRQRQGVRGYVTKPVEGKKRVSVIKSVMANE